MKTDKHKVVNFLERIALLYGQSESPHKANAFLRAEKIIKETDISDITDFKWSDLEGIGRSIELEIDTYILTWTSNRLEMLGVNNER